MNEPEETQTLATDSRYVCSQTSSWEPQETHTKKRKQQKRKQGAYGLTDGLEDTVNEAGADLAGITGGTQAVNLTA